MDAELGLLLSLDGAAHETAPGAIVEFAVRRTKVTPQPRMHQLRAGAAAEGGWSAVGAVRQCARRQPARPRAETRLPMTTGTGTTNDQGAVYEFTTALQLLHDFWREVKRTLDEKGIPNDL